MYLDLEELQKIIGYQFQDPRLLKLALVHRSYLNEKEKDVDITEHNERLEFLGDAVLELIVTEYLYTHYSENEGYLTSLRASLVNYKTIGDVGNSLHLDQKILISQGEKAELGKARLSIVADCIEAIIGAMYLDGGYGPCRIFITEKILIKLPQIIANQTYKDSKTQLQEFTQKYIKMTPRYQVLSSEGKDHEKIFHVGVLLGTKMVASGQGRSKQEAETDAASQAFMIVQEKYGS